MAFWLFKQEPTCYSLDDLERDGETIWDGISNALALKHLRTVQPGDRVLFYHTGKDKAVVGIMEVAGEPRPDPNSANDKLVVVPVKMVRRLEKPVTLETIKSDPVFANWDLLRMSRLSVVPVTAEIWKRIEELASGNVTAVPVEKRSVGKRK